MNDENITTVEILQMIRDEIKSVHEEVKSVRTEMRDEIKSVRDEVKSVRDEVQRKIKSVRDEIRESETRTSAEIQRLRKGLQGMDNRLRAVEDSAAGREAVSTFQENLGEWSFRVAAAIGLGGAIKMFFS